MRAWWSTAQWTLALDIGGTKLAAGLVRADGSVVVHDSAPRAATALAEALFADLLALCDRVLAAGGVHPPSCSASASAAAARCSTPRAESRRSTSRPGATSRSGRGSRQRYGRPALVDNDAKALALGEHWIGAGRGARCLLGMVVSTGVGGGIVEDGRLIHGVRGNAGHVGHVIAFRNGPPCGCGARGCVEAVASGTGLAKRARRAKAAGLLPSLPDAARPARTWSRRRRPGDRRPRG